MENNHRIATLSNCLKYMVRKPAGIEAYAVFSFFSIFEESSFDIFLQVAEGEKMLYSDEVISIDPVVCHHLSV